MEKVGEDLRKGPTRLFADSVTSRPLICQLTTPEEPTAFLTDRVSFESSL